MKKRAPKILLIEDEKMLSEMYMDKFSQAGFEAILSSEAKKGLRLFKGKKKFDLIVLDILLPLENGIYFLEKLRNHKNPAISSIPVIIFSNLDDPEIERKARKLGIEDYLIKTNYTPNQIVKEIKKYLK
ncbi:response regulator transcription factor [Candidatus Parcubacteria bacterium]|nr:response regulator transcription factor [Candidatus Parcubacteria bacterium]